MAGDFIKIDVQMNGAAHANELLNVCRSLLQWRGQAQGLKSKLDHMIDGVDFTMLEAQCGLQAGQGQIVYDLLNGTLGNMNGQFGSEDNGKELSERIG